VLLDGRLEAGVITAPSEHRATSPLGSAVGKMVGGWPGKASVRTCPCATVRSARVLIQGSAMKQLSRHYHAKGRKGYLEHAGGKM